MGISLHAAAASLVPSRTSSRSTAIKNGFLEVLGLVMSTDKDRFRSCMIGDEWMRERSGEVREGEDAMPDLSLTMQRFLSLIDFLTQPQPASGQALGERVS